MQQHVKIIGILFIVFGLLYGIGAAFFFLGGATMMGVGGVAGETQEERGALMLGGGCVSMIGVMLAVLALPNIIAGWGLLKFREWARVLAIILAILHLPHLGPGTLLGIYALVILFNDQTKPLFTRQ
ncbi:MAG TPA: hypothetical protein VGF69_21940 [Thermoanaerobaculia bacterium]|jgi:hypothetical protein